MFSNTAKGGSSHRITHLRQAQLANRKGKSLDKTPVFRQWKKCRCSTRKVPGLVRQIWVTCLGKNSHRGKLGEKEATASTQPIPNCEGKGSWSQATALCGDRLPPLPPLEGHSQLGHRGGEHKEDGARAHPELLLQPNTSMLGVLLSPMRVAQEGTAPVSPSLVAPAMEHKVGKDLSIVDLAQCGGAKVALGPS